MKKFLLFLSLLSLIVLTVACGGNDEVDGNGDGDSEVTISFLTHWSAGQVDDLKDYIEKYGEVEPNVNVEVRAVPFGELLTTLSTQAMSSDGPTIAGIYDLWLPELVGNGIAAPSPDEFSDDIKSAYDETILQASTIEGEQYGYPNEIVSYALNYNKALFEEAGISDPPEDWDELIEYAQQLTKKDDSGNFEQQGFGIINSWDSGTVHPWLAMLHANGGQLLTDDKKPLLDSKEAEEVTKLYEQLIFEYETTSPEMATANASTTGPYLDNFANGNTAMIIMANWWESALKDSMGDDFANVGTAPVPVGPSGSESKSVSYSWLTTVNAHATEQQQEAAWNFLQWLNSPDSGSDGSSAMGELLISMGILPSRTSDLEAHDEVLNTEFLQTYVDELPNAIPFPVVLSGNELSTSLQNHLETMQFGQESTEDVLKNAQTDLSDILSQHYDQ